MSIVERTAPYRQKAVWLRGLFMLLLMFGLGVAHVLWNLVAVLQFVWVLLEGGPNGQLARFGAGLALWAAEAVRFLTFADDDKPFPWRNWPAA